MRLTNSAAILLVVLFCWSCFGAPEPALVQGPSDWTLDVKFEHLRQIELRAGADRVPMRFWYIILTVTNNTGQDVDFYPKCELMTDTFQVISAGSKTPTEVFEHIKKRHDNNNRLSSRNKEGAAVLFQLPACSSGNTRCNSFGSWGCCSSLNTAFNSRSCGINNNRLLQSQAAEKNIRRGEVPFLFNILHPGGGHSSPYLKT